MEDQWARAVTVQVGKAVLKHGGQMSSSFVAIGWAFDEEEQWAEGAITVQVCIWRALVSLPVANEEEQWAKGAITVHSQVNFK